MTEPTIPVAPAATTKPKRPQSNLEKRLRDQIRLARRVERAIEGIDADTVCRVLSDIAQMTYMRSATKCDTVTAQSPGPAGIVRD